MSAFLYLITYFFRAITLHQTLFFAESAEQVTTGTVTNQHKPNSSC